ncbi:gliding motility-associated C-terminal domain-containing protein [Hymenobacter monticola]|uniref:Gliding motility-associated C-terminal domain-containing protein n=1 Tax=Hymenobacter monticola TaxID=1705399 RepID=A0ABY4AZI4_9BACT|nr:gliding motility-associated C-terminal domain-containing protein [Hymenobacter monticola]UOE32269.1 gliding motility-associated C-terminal domain-containing protein [Hymenobacter monticola]
MIQFSLLRVGTWARAALLLTIIAAGLSLRPDSAWATHIRAGDIQAKPDTVTNNPRRVFFKLVLYTDNSSSVPADFATVFYGDGTSSCSPGVPRSGPRRAIPGNTDTSVNIYYFDHVYPSTGSFTVSYIGENRNAGVLNMDNSVNTTFYISTTITIDPALGRNRSPIFTAPAVDKAARNQVYLHNPAAYDADGDSLAFHLRSSQMVPLGITGTQGPPCAGTGTNNPAPVPVTNFRLPNSTSITGSTPLQVAYGGTPPGRVGDPAIFEQDVNTGQITWNAPEALGFYNVAFEVEEWRRTPLGRRRIGVVIRDMQIIVTASNNLRPTITVPADICVVAGQTVTGSVTAVDDATGGAQQTPISLFAYSGIIPPATFRQSQTGPPQAQGTFTWQTDCSNVARLPYLVVFKAQDSPAAPAPPLIDEKAWRITVVGPPPQNLRATPATGTLTSAVLTWNPYICTNASQIHIYRKVNSSNFVPGPCDTGIPASAGYTRIGTVAASATTFTDTNLNASGVAQGLDRGQTYCYRIYAEFPLPAGGASIASQEACVSFQGNAARLVKVDVENTSTTTGQMQVCWTRPRPAGGGTFDGTPSYVLSRGEGLNPSTFAPIATLSSLVDTCYTDTQLNTQDLQYTYKLEFVRTFPPGDARAPIREASPTASSVRTSAVPASAAATAVRVSWTYNVPWDNASRPAIVFRRTGSSGAFVRIGTAPTTNSGGTYTDSDPTLVKGQTYCYYVQTDGQYPGVAYLNSLQNRSQVRCLVLQSPPCTPKLTLEPTNCDELAARPQYPTPNDRYTNRLSWTLSDSPTGCDTNVSGYRVYYRPTPSGAFTFLGTTAQPSYVHSDLASNGGCYAVQAVGNGGVLSDTSNVACQDNCLFFVLPNVFTPNGDNQNAVFRPKNNSPVRRVHFQAFNRWGVKVFENTTTASDPVLINWDGGGPVGEAAAGPGRKASDGVYFYLAEVEFADFSSTKRTYKGWVEIIR